MENWAPVVGYEGLYEVSDLGRVRSLDRTTTGARHRKIQGKVLTLNSSQAGGYHVVGLWRDNKIKNRKVSCLVLEAFVGPRPPGLVARHFPDRDPTNNQLSNLSWATAAQNGRDRRGHGTDHEVNKTHCPLGHILAMPNLCKVEWERDGHRKCLACSRGRAAVAHQRLPKSALKNLANQKYVAIMEQNQEGTYPMSPLTTATSGTTTTTGATTRSPGTTKSP